MLNNFLICLFFLSVSSIKAQNGFYIGMEGALKFNFTEVTDPDISPQSLLLPSFNSHFGFTAGYKFKSIPLSLEGGFQKSGYTTKMRVKDGQPIFFGFGKPWITKVQFGAKEIFGRIVWHYSNNTRKLSFQGLVGFAEMKSILDYVHEDSFTGDQSREINGKTFQFQYEFIPISSSYVSSRVEIGFGSVFKANDAISFSFRTILGVGLSPALYRGFNFKITTSSGSSLTDTDDIIVIDRADQLFLELGSHFYFSNLFRKR